MKLSKWVGRQSARLKQGVIYFTIITSTASAVSLLKLAFDLDIFAMAFLVPLLLAGSWLIGLILDKKNIVSEDLRKNTEMQARYWSDADEKSAQVQCETQAVIASLIGHITIPEARQLMNAARAYVRNQWLPIEERKEI